MIRNTTTLSSPLRHQRHQRITISRHTTRNLTLTNVSHHRHTSRQRNHLTLNRIITRILTRHINVNRMIRPIINSLRNRTRFTSMTHRHTNNNQQNINRSHTRPPHNLRRRNNLTLSRTPMNHLISIQIISIRRLRRLTLNSTINNINRRNRSLKTTRFSRRLRQTQMRRITSRGTNNVTMRHIHNTTPTTRIKFISSIIIRRNHNISRLSSHYNRIIISTTVTNHTNHRRRSRQTRTLTTTNSSILNSLISRRRIQTRTVTSRHISNLPINNHRHRHNIRTNTSN